MVAAAGDQAGSLALVGGLVIDGTGRAPIENGVVLIKGNRIAAVGRYGELSIPTDAEVIDVSGKAVLPGLIDMHVHLNDGSAVPLSLFVSAGVTSVRDVGNFTEVVKRLAEQNQAPRIFYSGESLHSGPYTHISFATRVKTEKEARRAVRQCVQAGASLIKLADDISPEILRAIIEEAHSYGLPVTYDFGARNRTIDAATAIEMGLDGIEHASGIPSAVRSNRAPAPKSEELVYWDWRYKDKAKEQALIDAMVARGTFLTPTLVTLEKSALPIEAALEGEPAAGLVPLELKAIWQWKKRNGSPSWREMWAFHLENTASFVARFVRAGGRVVAGSDTPTPGVVPGYGLHRELELLVEAGLMPLQAIQAATKNAAEFLAKGSELGTLEPGKLADIIVVSGNPLSDISAIRKISLVILDGRQVK